MVLMEWIRPVIEILTGIATVIGIITCLWPSCVTHANYLYKLQENGDSLEKALKKLKNARDDVQTVVDVAESNPNEPMKRKDQVNEWLQSVTQIEDEVVGILQQVDQEPSRRCLGGYILGRSIVQKIASLDELREKGRFEEVAYKLPPPSVQEEPTRATVGMKSMFDKVWSLFVEDEVRIMGLYGYGGVGKTTLLKQINNAFLKIPTNTSTTTTTSNTTTTTTTTTTIITTTTTITHGFDVVILVKVSDALNIDAIQKKIGNRLGLSSSDSISIFNALTKKRFVLLLDDIWKTIDLQSIGVPPLENNKSKVIFTTRSETVCWHMDANIKYRVECLLWDEAWTLFQEKVGNETLNSHPEVSELAEVVAKECGGLPIALITIGRAMSSKKTVSEWNHAITTLQESASEFPGMSEEVLPILKRSYDSLHNDTVKSCFLYCAARYPEDDSIDIPKLIDGWIREGFISLNEFKNLDNARNKGYDVIGDLKGTCLLESGEKEETEMKMNAMIRKMALWIARDKNFIIKTSDLTAERSDVIPPPDDDDETKVEQQQQRQEPVQEEVAYNLPPPSVQEEPSGGGLPLPLITIGGAPSPLPPPAPSPPPLITIGGAMSSKKTVHEWNPSITTLQKFASKFPGMDKEVLTHLKLSYDNLGDDMVKSCFLYFALYPEHHSIYIPKLIDYWIGEGLISLSDFNHIDKARNHGFNIIGILKGAKLLESGRKKKTEVKMNAMIRNLALWIAHECENKMFTIDTSDLTTPERSSWYNAERIYLIPPDDGETKGRPPPPSKSPYLITLIHYSRYRVAYSDLSVLPQNFFEFTPLLRVLDLSYTSMETFPASITELLELRYLSLSGALINELPEELGKLVKLNFLDLSHMWSLVKIPSGVIGSLLELRVLNLFDSHKVVDWDLGEVYKLKHLNDVGITIKTQRNLNKLLRNQNLQMCTTHLSISGIPEANMGIEHLGFSNFHYLIQIEIRNCNGWKDLTWVGYVPNLKTLVVGYCKELEEIIIVVIDDLGGSKGGGGGNKKIFKSLKTLRLCNLPKLKSICRNALAFPCLEELIVNKCPQLKKLPFDSGSNLNDTLQKIEGGPKWWSELHWEEEDHNNDNNNNNNNNNNKLLKSKCLLYFIEYEWHD